MILQTYQHLNYFTKYASFSGNPTQSDDKIDLEQDTLKTQSMNFDYLLTSAG